MKKKYNITNVELDCWGGAGFKHPNNTGGFILKWSCKDIGFGELTFYTTHDGKVVCETECMGQDFIQQVLEYFMKSVVYLNK